jgi:cytosine/adenosine deaminase-related metal-dependent hydrolase
LARVGHGSDAMTAEGALRLATAGSAALLGRTEELGSIAVGKAADLVLVDVSGIDRAGALEDPLAAVVFTGIGQRVHTSIVNGEIVVRDGRLVRVDEAEIARNAQAISSAMLRRAGHAPRFASPPWLA